MSITRAEIQRCLRSDELHLILLPTEACNLRCVYCYESFKLKRMEPWVVTAVKRLLDRRFPTLRRLSISWFGGEPLLAADLIEDIQGHVQRWAALHGALTGATDVTTNGTLLTRSVAGRLASLGVESYQVTFDGPREFHDRKRIHAGGRGTFDLIWNNLTALRDSPLRFQIMVRVHVDHDNLESMGRFLEEYRRAFGADPRFELFLRGLSRLGGANDASLRILEGAEGALRLQEIRARAAALGLRQAPHRPADDICYAARANSFVVRADGRLNKCTVALEHPHNQVGRLREDGTMELIAASVRPWMRGVESGDRAELQCPSRGLADADRDPGLARPAAIHLALSRAREEVTS